MDSAVAQGISEKTHGASFIVNYRSGAGSKVAIGKALNLIAAEVAGRPKSQGFTYVFNEELEVFERVSLQR
jgi:hypothetical protein